MNALEQAINDLEARRGEDFTQITLHLLTFKEALPLMSKLTSTNPVHMTVFMGLIQTFSGLTTLVAGAKGFKDEDLISESEKLTEIVKKLAEENTQALASIKLVYDFHAPFKGSMQ